MAMGLAGRLRGWLLLDHRHAPAKATSATTSTWVQAETVAIDFSRRRERRRHRRRTGTLLSEPNIVLTSARCAMAGTQAYVRGAQCAEHEGADRRRELRASPRLAARRHERPRQRRTTSRSSSSRRRSRSRRIRGSRHRTPTGSTRRKRTAAATFRSKRGINATARRPRAAARAARRSCSSCLEQPTISAERSLHDDAGKRQVVGVMSGLGTTSKNGYAVRVADSGVRN